LGQMIYQMIQNFMGKVHMRFASLFEKGLEARYPLFDRANFNSSKYIDFRPYNQRNLNKDQCIWPFFQNYFNMACVYLTLKYCESLSFGPLLVVLIPY